MAFPVGWPPRTPSGRRSVRVFISDTTTTAFDDKAFLFADIPGANTFTPTPVRAPGSKTPVSVGVAPDAAGAGGSGGSPLGGGVAAASHVAIYCQTLLITNDGTADVEFSFDGVVIHGVVKPGTSVTYRNRYEGGIALRSAAGGDDFIVEAW